MLAALLFALLLTLTMGAVVWIRLAIGGISYAAEHEPRWSRKLGEWWKRKFPSHEEREQMRRGFEVKPLPPGSNFTESDERKRG